MKIGKTIKMFQTKQKQNETNINQELFLKIKKSIFNENKGEESSLHQQVFFL